MNFQKYKLLILGGGVCLLLLAGGAFLLIKYRSGYVAVHRNLKSSTQNLSALRGNKPFPSEANIEVVDANLAVMRESLEDLKSQISKGQVKPLSIGRAEFPQVLEKTLQGLRQSSTNRNVNLPAEGFDFGFERYAKGDLPDKDKVERLTTQLQIVAHLSEVLFKSGIRDMLSVKRDVFETAQPGGGMPGMLDPMTGRMSPVSASMGGMQGPDAGAQEPGSDLYTKERVTLIFAATDSALWQVLNNLAADPMFTTVVSVDLRNPIRPDGTSTTGGREGSGGGRLSTRPSRGGVSGSSGSPFSADPYANPYGSPFEERSFEDMLQRETGGTARATTPEEPKGPEVSELSHDERVVAGFESVLAKIQVDVLMLKTDDKPEEPGETTEEATP